MPPLPTCGDVDVDPVGKGRVMLDQRPEPVERDASPSSTKKTRCGLPTLSAIGFSSSPQRHRQRGGVHRDRRGERPPSRSAARAIATSTSLAIGRAADHAAAGLDGLRAGQRDHAARGIAAALDLAAVMVPDPHPQIGHCPTARARSAGRSRCRCGGRPAPGRGLRHRQRLLARVEDREVVAEAVHLVEGACHCRRVT